MANEYSPAWFETFGRPDEAQTAVDGYRVTGVEHDPAVAEAARADGVEVHELDVRRLDELEATFDAVVCLWASFGWFDDATNVEVFAAMARKARAVLVLDLYDPAFFRGRDGVRENRGVRDEKRVVGDRLETTLTYPDGRRDGLVWRLYEPNELRALGAATGLRLVSPAPTGGSPRSLHVFRRDT